MASNKDHSTTILEAAQRIKLVVFDVDGTLTDGQMYYLSSGNDMVAFNAHDGYALRTLTNAGLQLAVISGRESKAVRKRMQSLGITHIYLGIQNKIAILQTLMQELAITAEQLCYVGDDWIDLPAIELAGLGIAAGNAVPAVQQAADLCTQANGGKGVAREVIELILSAQGLMHFFHPNTATEECEDAG